MLPLAPRKVHSPNVLSQERKATIKQRVAGAERPGVRAVGRVPPSLPFAPRKGHLQKHPAAPAAAGEGKLIQRQLKVERLDSPSDWESCRRERSGPRFSVTSVASAVYGTSGESPQSNARSRSLAAFRSRHPERPDFLARSAPTPPVALSKPSDPMNLLGPPIE
jgi:hypothetical protein